jgi:hypothetical protein
LLVAKNIMNKLMVLTTPNFVVHIQND